MGVSQTAVFNRGRHLYSAGRPSGWALAHISSYCLLFLKLLQAGFNPRSRVQFPAAATNTWMGDCLQVANHLSISPSCTGQLSLVPSVGQEMSTSQSAATVCGWGLKACMVQSTCRWTCGWRVKLCDLLLTCLFCAVLCATTVHSAVQHMNRPNSCLLVRFSFSLVILCVTV